MDSDDINQTDIRKKPLPRLSPLIRLTKGQDGENGSPTWTLYSTVTNEHYKIGWAEFECLARFEYYKTVGDLIDAVNKETTLTIEPQDVDHLLTFLDKHGLLDLEGQSTLPAIKPKKAFWKSLLHGYLYFTIPIIKPEKFLKSTLPYIRPLLTRSFVMIMGLIFLIGLFMTLQRADEFFNSFAQLLTPTGIAAGLLIFAFLKIIHEFAHAYTATKYGVKVPHMGIAFIVLYPVLYTETTASWQITSRRSRLLIGIAGILAELSIAAIALILWNFTSAGSVLQTLCFTLVTLSLVASLLVNLNPLMRFDGYYILSDLSGFDNLQSRSCAYARWFVRQALFHAPEDKPEILSKERERFLITFGLMLLIYRFFLFLGIAVLVYILFSKPLGLFLMMVELYWFILLPIWSEVKIWFKNRTTYIQTRRTRLSLAILGFILLLIILPWRQTVSAPAVAHANHYMAVYSEYASVIESLTISDRQSVKQGQVLAKLSSPDLERDLMMAEANLTALKNLRRVLLASPDREDRDLNAVKDDILQAQQNLQSLREQKNRLTIIAPFDGEVRDMAHHIHEGMYLAKDSLLFRLIGKDNMAVTAYIAEDDIARITPQNKATFIPAHAPLSPIHVDVESISKTSAPNLTWLELSSVYDGPLPAVSSEDEIQPIQGVFTVKLLPQDNKSKINQYDIKTIQTGTIQIHTSAQSLIMKAFNAIAELVKRESGLNA